jgi:predicted permease
VRWLTTFRLRLQSLFRSARVEQELTDEFQFHLQHLIETYVAAGMSPEDARLQAVRDMGAIEPHKEACRDTRGFTLLESVLQDCRYAVRAIGKNPGFSLVVILSLAIGIGANTTIFSFVNAVLMRPLPYPLSDRLVVFHEHKIGSTDLLSVHPTNFVEWRARARSFEAVALVQTPPLNVTGSQGVEQVSRMLTTSELFRVFRVAPALGRAFTDDETRPGRPAVAILGYQFWQRWFGGDAGVLGRQLMTPTGPLRIVGVAPARFRIGQNEPEVFTPLTIDPTNPSATGSRAFDCYGRLAPGVTLATAQSEMNSIASTLRQAYRFDQGLGVSVEDLHDFLVREARPGLRLLMMVVATVLAITCLNLAGLLTARGMARRPEFALRAALGASRARLVRQLVIESVVLSLLGGAAALAVADWGTHALAVLAAGTLSGDVSMPVGLDLSCLLFTLLVSSMTALAVGLIPARQAAEVEPQNVLRQHTRGGTADPHHRRLRSTLVTAQVALAVILLVGAGLLLRTFSNLVRVDIGFQPAHTLTMNLFLGMRPPAARSAIVDQMIDRIDAMPGVQAAGTIQFLPLRGMTCGTGFWLEERAAEHDPSAALPTDCSLVSRGFFAAMGIPIINGRVFDGHDRLDGTRVLVVNQSFGKRYFPDGHVLGRRILVQGSNQALAEIVGVVGDVRDKGLTFEPAPTVFLLHAQTPGYITNLVVRANGDPTTQAMAIRKAIHQIDPTQAVSVVRTLEEDVSRVLARPRLEAALVTCFAAIAVVLTLLGIYGLVAYVVALRTHEIGIRLSLGATRWQIFRGLFGTGAQVVIGGVALGTGAALGLRQIASTFVFGITTADPLTYAIVGVTFSAVGLVAVWIPVHRASRLDPVRALRLD